MFVLSGSILQISTDIHWSFAYKQEKITIKQNESEVGSDMLLVLEVYFF